MATAPVAPPLTNYYTANDSSPGSQVWDLAAGAFVNVSDATFLLWLAQLTASPVGAPYYPFNLQILSAISSDGGTTTTFNVNNTTGMTTGAVYNISATGLYDGQFALTVVNGTQIKTSQAFTSSATGQISGAQIAATIATVYAAIDFRNRNFILQNEGVNSTTSAVDLTLTNPLKSLQSITMSAAGKSLIFPQANLVGSVAIGVPTRVINAGAVNALTVKRSDSAIIFNTLNPGDAADIVLLDNTTAHGTYEVVYIPSSLTFPLSVGLGGTGDTGTAWGTWVPVITAQTPGGTPPTFTLNSARFKTLGKTVFFEVDFTVTAAGTGTGGIEVTLPVTAAAHQYAASAKELTTGKMCSVEIGQISATIGIIFFFDATTPITTNNEVVATGVYEST